MFFGQYMMGATIIVLIAEILAGRHKGHHGANEKLVLWGSAISGVAIARPLSALLQAWLMGLVLPQWQGALGGISFSCFFCGPAGGGVYFLLGASLGA